ncbi:MAG: response regulator transcription factor [Betaproteobacteria bacterium]|nr:response regulator transcription factor [Betaproteobacteria bacterium]
MIKPDKIRVYIVDDHAIVREGVKQILADTPDMVWAGDSDNGHEAIRMARQGGFDLLLLDISMPERSGIEVLKQIRKEVPEINVLILSMHREDQYAIRTLKAGASGYLNKQSAPDELVGAIREIVAGRKYISKEVAQALANQVSGDHQTAPHETLSDREYQTLTMIASGKCVSDIGKELNLSVKTVSMYRSRLLHKMKLKNNAELMHYAMRNKLV